MKRILSYLYPFQLKSYTSNINGTIEINLINGKKTLDTSNSNYSYGSLQKILKFGLRKISPIKDTDKILLLGLGGGSVIETIREDFKCEAFIEAVDIDPEIIAIAKNDFNINRYKNLKIIQSDAIDYIAQSKKAFDIIIVDLFVIDTIPEIFTQSKFIINLQNKLKPNGQIIYNTMSATLTKERLFEIKKTFESCGSCIVKIFNKVEETNNLIVVKKLFKPTIKLDR